MPACELLHVTCYASSVQFYPATLISLHRSRTRHAQVLCAPPPNLAATACTPSIASVNLAARRVCCALPCPEGGSPDIIFATCFSSAHLHAGCHHSSVPGCARLASSASAPPATGPATFSDSLGRSPFSWLAPSTRWARRPGQRKWASRACVSRRSWVSVPCFACMFLAPSAALLAAGPLLTRYGLSQEPGDMVSLRPFF